MPKVLAASAAPSPLTERELRFQQDDERGCELVDTEQIRKGSVAINLGEWEAS
jgi:hypothetical protein